MFISWIAGHGPEGEKYKILKQKLNFKNETETATEAQLDMVMGLLRSIQRVWFINVAYISLSKENAW